MVKSATVAGSLLAAYMTFKHVIDRFKCHICCQYLFVFSTSVDLIPLAPRLPHLKGIVSHFLLNTSLEFIISILNNLFSDIQSMKLE